MRIPIDALAFYVSEGEHKAHAESTRTGPVEGSAGLRPALSQPFSEQQHTFENDKNATLSRRTPFEYGGLYGEERRYHERRKQNLPALLNTRLKQRRQEPARYPIVNFDI